MKKNIGGVKFSRSAAPLGVIGGAAVAVGLPLIILVFGQHLHVAMQSMVIVMALMLGGLTVLLAALSGAIMPTSVGPIARSSDDDEQTNSEASPDETDADADQRT